MKEIFLIASLLPTLAKAGICSDAVVLAIAKISNTTQSLVSNTFAFKKKIIQMFASLGDNRVLYINDLDSISHKNFLMALDHLAHALERSTRRLPVSSSTIYSIGIVDKSKRILVQPSDRITGGIVIEIPYDAPSRHLFEDRLFAEMAEFAIQNRMKKNMTLSIEDDIDIPTYADALESILKELDERDGYPIFERIHSLAFTKGRKFKVGSSPSDSGSQLRIIFPIHLSQEKFFHRLTAAVYEAEIFNLLTEKYGRRGHGTDINLDRLSFNDALSDKAYEAALGRLIVALRNYRRGEKMDIFKHLGTIHLVADSSEPFIQRYDSMGGDKFFALYMDARTPFDTTLKVVDDWIGSIGALPAASARFLPLDQKSP